MAQPDFRRRLIVNADDFGISPAANEAILRAHREGILTTASLMVTGKAFAEAVTQARDHPDLGVGLHLVLADASPFLTPDQIPGLVRSDGRFSPSPAAAGLRIFFKPSLRDSLRRELAAQFECFHRTGLPLDHVIGHHHLHLHPVVLDLLTEHAVTWGIRHLRLTRDPFLLNARIASGRWLHRLTLAFLFQLLARRARRRLAQCGIRHASFVFGLLQSGRVTEEFISRLLPVLPDGDSELYSHPSVDGSKSELDALLSPRVRRLVETQRVELIRYRDL
jgi:hopanoid biosynthesis associated protein HpnK